MIHHYLRDTPILERSRQIRALIRDGRIGLAGNKRLKLFGRLDCASGKRMKSENRVFFADERGGGRRLPALRTLPEGEIPGMEERGLS